MSHNQIVVAEMNPTLFGNVDMLTVVGDLSGEPTDGEAIFNAMTAAGLPLDVQDAIARAHFRLLYKTAEAAFRAGYLVGRDPDRLLLSAAGSVR